jgi:Putative auto-transporter adhesin, head GIN domain
VQSGSARTPLIIAGFAALATYIIAGHHGPIGFLQTVGLLHHHTASAKVTIDDDADTAQEKADEALEKADQARAKAEKAVATIPPIPPVPAVPEVPAASEMREVAPFDKIEFTENADATVEIGDTQSVKVSGANINTDVKDGKLVVSGHGGARIVVTVPHLRSLEANGASKVKLVGLKDSITIAAHGPVQISATGTVESADLTMDGPSKLAMTKLETKNMTIKLNGFGDAEVFATDTLTASVNGVGHIRYLGDPHTVSNVHGLGSIEKLQS